MIVFVPENYNGNDFYKTRTEYEKNASELRVEAYQNVNMVGLKFLLYYGFADYGRRRFLWLVRLSLPEYVRDLDSCGPLQAVSEDTGTALFSHSYIGLSYRARLCYGNALHTNSLLIYSRIVINAATVF